MNLANKTLDRTLVGLVLILLIVQVGCTPWSPLIEIEARQQLGTVAVVPAQYPPHIRQFKTMHPLKSEKTHIGDPFQAGPLFPIALLIASGKAEMNRKIDREKQWGPVQLKKEEEYSEEALDIDFMPIALQAAVTRLDMQHELANHLTSTLQKENWIHLSTINALGPAAPTKRFAPRSTYAELRPVGIDTVLEVAISEIGLRNFRSASRLNDCQYQNQDALIFYMLAEARLVRTQKPVQTNLDRISNRNELFSHSYLYESACHEIAQWEENDGRLLAETLEEAYREISIKIHDDAFLVTPIVLVGHNPYKKPDQHKEPKFQKLQDELAYASQHSRNRIAKPRKHIQPSNPLADACWLTPIYPQIVGQIEPQIEHQIEHQASLGVDSSLPDDQCFSVIGFSTVNSLHPMLQWSSFPREIDHTHLDPALLQKINNVSYDLKVWEVAKCERNKLIYERSGLNTPQHQLEAPLKPNQRYFWSIRARFTVNDQPMTTRWAFSYPNCSANESENRIYYRFVTPNS